MRFTLVLLLLTVISCILITYLIPREIMPAKTSAPSWRQLRWCGTYEGENYIVTVCAAGCKTLLISTWALLLSSGGTALVLLLWTRLAWLPKVLSKAVYFPRLLIIFLVVAWLDLESSSRLWMAKENYLVLILAVTGMVYLLSQLAPELERINGRGYIHFARSLELPEWKILVRHVLPNCSTLPLILAKQWRDNLLFIATLTFLGCVTLQPPELGGLICQYHERSFSRHWWWLLLFPTMLLSWLVLLAYQLNVLLENRHAEIARRA